MSANVFANGREISGKASANKSIAALPDVCLSPPSPPAGPIPVPYPNTAMASDTADGSKTVKIGGKEVGLKDSSTYSTSTGDEPATQSFGANVVSHKIKGPMRFAAWSSDVKIEGENAIRLGDLTTHNHSNPQGSSSVAASVAGAAPPPTPKDCEELHQENNDARSAMASSQKKTYEGVAQQNTTVTHGTYSPPTGGPSIGIKACSRVVASVFDDGFVKGKQTQGQETKSVICGKEFTYPKSYRPLTSHTESRILETLHSQFGQAAGGVLTLAINWNKPAGVSNDACDDCDRLICAASKCIDIYLCKGNTPVKQECPD